MKTVQIIGKEFEIATVAHSVDEANEYCEEHPDCGVFIALMSHDWIYYSLDGVRKLGNPLEAKCIKEDLLEIDYFDPNDKHDLPLELVEDSPLNAYLQAKISQTYVEWLESFWIQKQKESICTC